MFIDCGEIGSGCWDMARNGKFEVCETIYPGSINRDRSYMIHLPTSFARLNECLEVLGVCFLGEKRPAALCKSLIVILNVNPALGYAAQAHIVRRCGDASLIPHKPRLGLADLEVVITQPLLQKPRSFAVLAIDYAPRNPNKNPSEGFKFVIVPPRNLAIKALILQ